MKIYLEYFTSIALLFSINSFGQNTTKDSQNLVRKSMAPKLDTITKDNQKIVGYLVQEITKMPHGKRVVKYTVSKLEMIEDVVLGPDNERIVTPIYKKVKHNKIDLKTQTLANISTNEAVKPIEINVETPKESELLTVNIDKKQEALLGIGLNSKDIQKGKTEITPKKEAKYLTVNIVDTYANVLDKRGIKSADMLKKVGDRAYFEGDLKTAAKYYKQLIDLGTDLEPEYHHRYQECLKDKKNW